MSWTHDPIGRLRDRWCWDKDNTEMRILHSKRWPHWILRDETVFDGDVELPDGLTLQDMQALAVTLWRLEGPK